MKNLISVLNVYKYDITPNYFFAVLPSSSCWLCLDNCLFQYVMDHKMRPIIPISFVSCSLEVRLTNCADKMVLWQTILGIRSLLHRIHHEDELLAGLDGVKMRQRAGDKMLPTHPSGDFFPLRIFSEPRIIAIHRLGLILLFVLFFLFL